MSLKGYAHFARSEREIIADRIFWKRYCNINISEIVKIIIENSEDLECVVCGHDYTLNYSKKSSLYRHYKNHNDQTIEYYLDNLISKSIAELDTARAKTEKTDMIPNGGLT